MASITVTLTGTCTALSSYFHPEIELDERYNYSCCLLDFITYNSIPNVHGNNNKLYFKLEPEAVDDGVGGGGGGGAIGGGIIGKIRGKNNNNNKSNKTIENLIQKIPFEHIDIPIGAYEIDALAQHLATALNDVHLTCDKNSMKSTIKTKRNYSFDFQAPGGIGQLLGFRPGILSGSKEYVSDDIVNIQSVATIRVNCDLTNGSYHNGERTHTIYEFSPTVDPGYKMVVQPKNLIYLPIVRHRISSINITVVDQNGELVDFRGEQITCRLHIRRDH